MLSGDGKALLRISNIEDIDPKFIFAYKIPEGINEIVGNENKLLFLFEDVSDNPTTYGSDIYHEMEQTMSLRIFFPSGYSKDTSIIQQQIMRYFEKNDFKTHSTSGVIMLPDSDKMQMRINFKREISVPI